MNKYYRPARAIFIGIMLFIAFTISKIITDKPITLKTLLPGIVGGLVGGFAVYFFSKLFHKKG